MKEIMMEMEILRTKMEKHTEEKISFGNILYSITNKLGRGEIFNMTDEEMVKHIQKIQLLES